MNELAYRDLIMTALREDRADFDVTSTAVIPPEATGKAQIVAKEEGVLAGLPVAAAVFAAIDPGLEFISELADGNRLRPGLAVATLRGRLRSILAGERVALNFLQHLSGIATATAALVERVKDHPVKILDTRKTTPGLRALEKYAVRVGGGANHRFSLADMLIIKDNHIAAAGSVAEAVRRARAAAPPFLLVEVEAENEEQVREALAAGADVIMLDNMSPAEMRRMVALVAGRARLEASGKITPENVAEVAATGVDYISVGYITHSAPALDLSLEVTAVM